MSLLNVKNLSHGFGARQILSDVSFRLLKGEHVALVGANGEGKSTFLEIITKQKLADEGTIDWSKRVTVGYLDQHANLEKGKSIRDILRTAFDIMFGYEAEMLAMYDKMGDASDDEMAALLDDVGEIQLILEHHGFYTLDAKIEEVANGLGLGDIGLDRDVSELSGGQRTKVLLTKLLLESPSILILDEPTNHLDENHIVWLTRYLQNYENSFILVSHDIPFLNSVCNLIYNIESSELVRYKGTHEDFVAAKELKSKQQDAAFEKQQKEVAKLEDFIARNKARVATTGMAKSRQKKLDKMDIIEKSREKIKPTFGFKEARAPGRFLFQTHDLVLGYDEPLTRPLNISIERGQKIAIKGVNGLGKSTLLKTLLGLIEPYSGTVEEGYYVYPGYFEQESSRENYNTAIEEIWTEYPILTGYEVRQILARSGLGNEQIESQMCVLSGGEAAKVRLTKIMLKEVNWLVLDEPTNHLDQDAKDELKRAIIDFKGTVIIVSHDPDFYNSVCTEVWNVEDWTVKVV